MIYTSKKEDELIITCDCGCGSGILWNGTLFDKEDEKFFVSLVEHTWYAKQTGRFKPYFKRLWKALRGKEYCLTELVMTKEDAKEFAEFLRRLVESV